MGLPANYPRLSKILNVNDFTARVITYRLLYAIISSCYRASVRICVGRMVSAGRDIMK